MRYSQGWLILHSQSHSLQIIHEKEKKQNSGPIIIIIIIIEESQQVDSSVASFTSARLPGFTLLWNPAF